MQKWEYFVIVQDGMEYTADDNVGRRILGTVDDLQGILNEAGKEGWELVAVFSEEPPTLLLKRHLIEEHEPKISLGGSEAL
jgi:hypothetical protein